MKLEPRTKTLHEFSDAALSHSQFCHKDNSKVKDVDEEQHFVENVSPHPLRWGLFGSCPLALWRRSLLEKWQYLCPLLFTGQYLCFLENNPHLTCNIHRDKPPSNPLENEKVILKCLPLLNFESLKMSFIAISMFLTHFAKCSTSSAVFEVSKLLSASPTIVNSPIISYNACLQALNIL